MIRFVRFALLLPLLAGCGGLGIGEMRAPTGDASARPEVAAETPVRPPARPGDASEDAPIPPPPVPRPRTLALAPPGGAETGRISDPPPRSGEFLRPVEGKVIVGYGRQEPGFYNDGINFAAPRGTPVRAAEAGVVTYAGNELPGFGNLVLIRHGDGWVSAYAHNDNFLVNKGDSVARGEHIAEVGSTGRVTSPQLHFQLRKDGEVVDPAPLIGGS